MARVVWTLDALADLEETADFITHAPYAKFIVTRAFELTDYLTEYPELGRVVPEFRMPTVRELILEHYRIVYEIGPEIRIVAFIHGARDLPNLAEERQWFDDGPSRGGA